MEVTFQQRAKRGISMKAHHLAALAALSAASALTLAACGGPTATQASAPGPVGASPSMTMPMAMPSPSFPAPVTATSVVITNFAFSPQAIVVKPGAEVTWTNKDADAHTVTNDLDGSGSQAFQNGETYRHTFTTTGTFRYHCSIHPYMVGEVIVANN